MHRFLCLTFAKAATRVTTTCIYFIVSGQIPLSISAENKKNTQNVTNEAEIVSACVLI